LHELSRITPNKKKLHHVEKRKLVIFIEKVDHDCMTPPNPESFATPHVNGMSMAGQWHVNGM
jgi:hypothetical protein